MHNAQTHMRAHTHTHTHTHTHRPDAWPLVLGQEAVEWQQLFQWGVDAAG